MQKEREKQTERKRERESIRHTRVIERSRAFTRRERASSVRSPLDSIGQSLPERENARGRYLRIRELFAGKNPAA